MFCREMFGKKPKTLTFGLQPHKIPDCDVVSTLQWDIGHRIVIISRSKYVEP